MKKIFCDLCNKETNDNFKYIFPYWTKYEIRGSGRYKPLLMQYDNIEDQELDICKSCRNKLATIIKQLEIKEETNE